MRITLFFIVLGFNFQIYSQTAGPIQIIDNSTGSGGAKHIGTADLNNDGLTDIIISRGYNIDDIGIYWNNGLGSFTADILGTVMDPVFTNFGDFDGNGFLDIVVITEPNGELWFYPNTNGSVFGSPVLVDTEATFGKVIEVADFDADADEDMVVIWQHSINFYRNDGNANFTKEPILTTATSPNLLECWDMKIADMDNDGDQDVVTAETIGGVVYENDGTGIFTPHTITGSTMITIATLSIFDADNDNLMDVAFHKSNGKISLFLNGGQLNFTHHSDMFTATQNSIKSIMATDANEDGFQDIYTAFSGDPRVFFNDGNMDFSQELILDPDPNLFVEETQVADITGDSSLEFIWAGAANTLAYQQLENLNIEEAKTFEIKIFPNPVKDQLKIISSTAKEAEIEIYGILGDKLRQEKLQFPIELSLSDFEKGIYFLVIRSEKSEYIEKIIKR